MTADFVNGMFEGCGACVLSLNTIRLVRDKKVQGVHWFPVVVWTLWGFWNLFYYPHLGQWWSFAGGCGVVLQNSVWLALWAKYSRAK